MFTELAKKLSALLINTDDNERDNGKIPTSPAGFGHRIFLLEKCTGPIAADAHSRQCEATDGHAASVFSRVEGSTIQHASRPCRADRPTRVSIKGKNQ